MNVGMGKISKVENCNEEKLDLDGEKKIHLMNVFVLIQSQAS